MQRPGYNPSMPGMPGGMPGMPGSMPGMPGMPGMPMQNGAPHGFGPNPGFRPGPPGPCFGGPPQPQPHQQQGPGCFMPAATIRKISNTTPPAQFFNPQ